MDALNPYVEFNSGNIDRAAVVTASLPAETLEAQAAALSHEDFMKLSQMALLKIPVIAVISILYLGAAIILFRSATRREDRRQAFVHLLEDLDISETKAYESLAIFKAFAKALLENRDLLSKFRLESLKRLSAKYVPIAAQEAALARAASGETISIPVAEAILEQHGVYQEQAETEVPSNGNEAEDSSTPSAIKASGRRSPKKVVKRRISQAREIWKYNSDDARVVIKSGKTQTPPYTVVIPLLEEALEQCRRELAEIEGSAPEPVQVAAVEPVDSGPVDVEPIDAQTQGVAHV